MRGDWSLRIPRKEASKAAAGGRGTARDPTNGPKDPSQRFECYGWYGAYKKTHTHFQKKGRKQHHVINKNVVLVGKN